jgi:CMP-N-acetylneuraminic acid synthetase
MNGTVLAIIPARGGSKGVPNKNLAQVAGRPLIEWTIDAARRATSLGRVVVTTDAPSIADAARKSGAEVPFLRPSELAQDDSPGMAAILHAVAWLAEHERYHPDYVMCLQPTSPLRTARDIDAAVGLLAQHEADSVVSVTPVDQHPYWMKQMDADGRLRDFMVPDRPAIRRQDLPLVYALNGAIYLAGRTVLVDTASWYTTNTRGYVMPPERSLDLDTPWLMHLADLMLRSQPHE